MVRNGVGSSVRGRLSAVLTGGHEFITVESAASALHQDRVRAAKTLARWVQQGWLKRVRRGLYTTIPLTVSPDAQVIEDAWRLVPELFTPGYIGGATAAHHWDLTEQLFRSVFVYTAAQVRRTEQTLQGVPFFIRHVPPELLFGTRPVWRGSVKVQVSDVHRTLIDMLDDPSAGGGIRHVADCLTTYLRRKDAEPKYLVDYAERLGNGAVFKRLGFLTERANGPAELVLACQQRLSSGISKLDPTIASPRVVRRWRLFLPESWKAKPATKP